MLCSITCYALHVTRLDEPDDIKLYYAIRFASEISVWWKIWANYNIACYIHTDYTLTAHVINSALPAEFYSTQNIHCHFHIHLPQSHRRRTGGQVGHVPQ